jgi:hypothetical protein
MQYVFLNFVKKRRRLMPCGFFVPFAKRRRYLCGVFYMKFYQTKEVLTMLISIALLQWLVLEKDTA